MKLLITGIVFLMYFAAASAEVIAGQTLGQKLALHSDFAVENASPADQLIEVARRFRIPMAVEWLEDENEITPLPLSFRGGSVDQLIESIVKRSPGHQLFIDDRLVHVYSSFAYSHRFNFLNLRITSFVVKDQSLLCAEFMLRHSIDELLYPEVYKGGWNGGYGCGCPPEFWKPEISISGSNSTIREILNMIIAGSGKFLWVVRLNREELSGDRPMWEGVPRDGSGDSPLNTRWRFVLLSE